MTARSAAACQPPVALRCISYLSPSLPYELFRTIAVYLASSLNVPSAPVTYETRFSAPPPGGPDPFALGEAELGFVCSTAVARTYDADCGFELLGCAPLFDHPRADGRPVYFAEVVVRRDSALRRPDDLRGRAWAYNDGSSLSGLYCLLQFMRERGHGPDFLGELRHSGSHLRSLDLVMDGAADAAAIDSTVLALQLRERPELRSGLRVVASWGPFPVQPLVVRRTLPEPAKLAIRQALLDMANTAQWRQRLSRFNLRGYGLIEEALYAAERRQIEDCQRAFGRVLAAASAAEN